MYYLFRTINHGRKHRLVVTTHSPYILHAVNNCMLLASVADAIPENIRQELDCKSSAISPDWVSVWQIEAGKLVDIKDPKLRIVGKHYFNDVMNDMLDDYYLMLPYLNILS